MSVYFGSDAPPPLIDTNGRPVVASDPNSSHFAIPHYMTFASIFNGSSRSYWSLRFDEALRAGREEALAMKRDAFYTGLLAERSRAVAGLPWHIKVPDIKDPQQKLVKETLTSQLERTLGLTRIHQSMLQAIWYGRYGIQPRWAWFPPTRQSEGRKIFGLDGWYPVNGDKINNTWSADSMLQINPIKAAEFTRRGAEVVTINLGTYLVLKGNWREYLIVHKHEIDDADYYEAEMAEGRFGVGVRSRIYWLDFLRRTFIEYIVSYMERVGLGITIWYYDANNPAAEAATDAAAEDQGRRAVLKVPVWRDSKGGTKGLVERIETPTTGVEALRSLVDYFDKQIERYIIGQEGSASATSSSGHSNHGSNDFMRDTKSDITLNDAKILGETYTGSDREPGLLSIMQRWSFPETRGKFQAQFVFTVDDEQNESKVTSGKTLYDMNVPIKEDEIRAAGGYSDPGDGDKILQKPAEQPGAPGASPPGADGNAAPAGGLSALLGTPANGDGGGQPPAPAVNGKPPTNANAPEVENVPEEDATPSHAEEDVEEPTNLMRLLGYRRGLWIDDDGVLQYAWTDKGTAPDGRRHIWYDPDTKQRRVQISEPGSRKKDTPSAPQEGKQKEAKEAQKAPGAAVQTTTKQPKEKAAAKPKPAGKPTLAQGAQLIDDFWAKGGDVGQLTASLSKFTVTQLKALQDEIQTRVKSSALKGERVKTLAERILQGAGVRTTAEGKPVAATPEPSEAAKAPEAPTNPFKDMLDTAFDPTRDIGKSVDEVGKNMTNAQVSAAAKDIGISRPLSKADALKAITQRITDRVGAFERSSPTVMHGAPSEILDPSPKPTLPDYHGMATAKERHDAREGHEKALGEWYKRQWDAISNQAKRFTGADKYGNEWKKGKLSQHSQSSEAAKSQPQTAPPSIAPKAAALTPQASPASPAKATSKASTKTTAASARRSGLEKPEQVFGSHLPKDFNPLAGEESSEETTGSDPVIPAVRPPSLPRRPEAPSVAPAARVTQPAPTPTTVQAPKLPISAHPTKDKADQASHQAHFNRVVSKFPKAAQEAIQKNLKATEAYPTREALAKSVGDEIAENEPKERREIVRRGTEDFHKGTHGLYDDRTQKLYLARHPGLQASLEKAATNDSPHYKIDSSTPESSAEHLMVHELGHAIDGPGYQLSRNPEWRQIWEKEIRNNRSPEGKFGLTKQATQDPREALAEAFRASQLGNKEKFKQEFPQAAAYLQKHGLLGESDSQHYARDTDAPADHHMTPLEFMGRRRGTGADHFDRVRDAVRSGQHVPEHVLSAYPALGGKPVQYEHDYFGAVLSTLAGGRPPDAATIAQAQVLSRLVRHPNDLLWIGDLARR